MSVARVNIPSLPAWVWDLVDAVDEFESTHVKADECLAEALSAVPIEVRGYAQGFVHGRRVARQQETQGVAS